ncbi:MAG: DUF1501 domain-containing protein, partial [Proteobacteria bacterium]|nr:DUF1501 domain-containing protein [Pseudomonadota bacterium]
MVDIHIITQVGEPSERRQRHLHRGLIHAAGGGDAALQGHGQEVDDLLEGQRAIITQGCLLAKRLVEVGVRFVEVTLGGWDTHDDNFNRVQRNLGILDPAVASLIEDLKKSGCNVIWIPQYDDRELVAALERHKLWITATPPGSPSKSRKSNRLIRTIEPFDSATRSILFWYVGTRIPTSERK